MENKREEKIPAILNKINAKVGVELGVFKGEFSNVLLNKWGGRLYMIDPWRPLGDEYDDACDEEQLYDLYADTTKNIKGHETQGFMLRGLGEELIDLFEDESLDFIYIDANHSYEIRLEEETKLKAEQEAQAQNVQPEIVADEIIGMILTGSNC